jgi:polyphosphate kinase
MDGKQAPVPELSAAAQQLRERYLNRELSWLDFNQRVLALAADRERPLLERVRFLSIFGSNLDEFFQVRVALLRAEVEAGIGASSPDGRTPAEQLAEVRARVLQLQAVEEQTGKELLGELADQGIRVVGWDDLDKRARKQLGLFFEEKRTSRSISPSWCATPPPIQCASRASRYRRCWVA